MRNLKIAVFCLTFAVVITTACNKTSESPVAGNGDEDYSELIEKSKAVQEHVRGFEKSMEYYRDNPGIKSISKQYVLDAINDWESTLNYNYCETYVDVNEIKDFDTIIPIPIDGELYMESADVSERYYNAILYAVQTRYYTYPAFKNQALLAVDLEPNSTYDSVNVSISIGNKSYVSHPPYDWKYGEWEGTCDGNYALESDAAQEAAKYIREYFKEAPPAGKEWCFIGIETINAKPLNTENGVLIYLNPEDDDGINNNMDYLIYYASASVSPGLTANVRCVEYYSELTFYKANYKDLTEGWINDSNGKKFYTCIYNGKNHVTYLQHELETKLGYRYIRHDIHIPPPIPD